MIGRRPRSHSQRNYILIQEIRQEAARLRQIDAGIGYRAYARERRAGVIEARPLHIGPQIEARPVGDAWDAA